ncbi:MAG: selenium metabolism-associated LysR family transcriptional regulator [Desulfuromonadales bacterium]|jgi:molybdate transport repressor ModE-like protein
MDLRQIKIFVAIAETGSFSAAADAVALTQSTVSQHISSLEEEMEVPLFNRLSRGISLTTGGTLFLRHARRILRESDALSQAMCSFRGLERAELIVGASNIPANYLVPQLLSTMKQEHPGISLTMLTGDTTEVLTMLEGAEIELALVGSRSDNSDIIFSPLIKDPLVLVVGSTHPWAASGRIGMDALFHQPLVMRETGSGSGQSLDLALRLAGHNPEELTIAARLGSNEAVLQAVASGYGGAFVSELSLKSWKNAAELKRIEIDGLTVERKIWMASARGRTFSPAAAAFSKILQTHYKMKQRKRS